MMRLFDPTDPTRVYIGTDTRASSLLLGALFAAAPLRRGDALVHARDCRRLYDVAIASIDDRHRCVLGAGRRPDLGVGVPRRAVRSLVAVGGARRRLCRTTRCRRDAWIGWAPLRVTGVLVVQPVPVALADLRADVGATDRAVRLAALRLPHRHRRLRPRRSRSAWIEDPIRFTARWARGRSGVVALISVTAGSRRLLGGDPPPGDGTGNVLAGPDRVHVDQLRGPRPRR